MSKSIDAIYEEGVFKPLSPVELKESQRVRLIVESPTQDTRQSVIERLKGMGHLLGQPPGALAPAEQLLSHEELQKRLPQLDPTLSEQVLEDRR
jgi:predicted DNA-binding antitoxin AbrB/MazE fold protein